jgi:hypothetical protein
MKKEKIMKKLLEISKGKNHDQISEEARKENVESSNF